MKKNVIPGVLLAAACASPAPQWTKPGATPESVAADVKTCRLSAPYEQHKPAPRTKMGAGGGLDSRMEQESARMRDEEQHVAQCMRAKGYTN